MVGSVNSTGSNTAVRDVQPRSDSRTSTLREANTTPRETERTERAEAPRSTDSTQSTTTTTATTELSTRNDTQTIRTEQTRGSLLDLAV